MIFVVKVVFVALTSVVGIIIFVVSSFIFESTSFNETVGEINCWFFSKTLLIAIEVAIVLPPFIWVLNSSAATFETILLFETWNFKELILELLASIFELNNDEYEVVDVVMMNLTEVDLLLLIIEILKNVK